MSWRVCGQPGCATTYDGNQSRCDEHLTRAKKAHWQDTKVYKSAGHREFRCVVLERDPICVLCHLMAATVADHWPKSRKDLILLGFNPDDPRFGRGLCRSCHNTQTAQHQPGGWANRRE
jgi:5-methylcytosine-specific restriction enzyme A